MGGAPVRPRRWRGGHERAASADGRRDRGATGRRAGEYGGGLLGSFLPGGDLFSDSEFELNRESRGGVVSIWSRSSRSYFRGMEGDLGDVFGNDRSFRRRSSHLAASRGLPCPRPARRAILRYLALIVAWQLVFPVTVSPLRILRRQRRRIIDTSSYSRQLGVSKLRTSSSFLARVAAT